jgi:hypothetical protein
MDERVSTLISQVEELRAKQAASEAVILHVLTPLVLASIGDAMALELITAMRSGFEVSTNKDGPVSERMRLVAEEHVNHIADQIERNLRRSQPR